MVAARSRMKQAESAAHSSGRSGGDRRVLEYPAAGVLQNIPMATVCTVAPLVCICGNDARDGEFRHFTKAQGGITAATRIRAAGVFNDHAFRTANFG
jgi:hypothetical protein